MCGVPGAVSHQGGSALQFEDMAVRISRGLPFKLVCIAFLLVTGYVSVERSVQGSSDFRGFHKIWSANALVATQPVRGEGTDPDPYPPTSYVIFAPLGYLPILPAAIVWYLLNVAASLLAYLGLEDLCGEKLRRTRTGWLLFASVVPFWVGNLVSGQNGAILICMIVWGYAYARRKRPVIAGLLLAVPVMIKAIPILFLMPFLVPKSFRENGWRVAGVVCLSSAIWIFVVSSLYFGARTNFLFQQRWLSMVVYGPDGTPADPFHPKSMHSVPRYGNQSSEAVLARLILDIPADGRASGFHVNVWSLKSSTWRLVRSTFAVAILSGCLFSLWRNGNAVPGLSEASLIALAMLLVSPIVWTHYYLWMVFSCLTLLKDPNRERWSRWLLIFWWLGELGLWSPWLKGIGVQLWLVICQFCSFVIGSPGGSEETIARKELSES